MHMWVPGKGLYVILLFPKLLSAIIVGRAPIFQPQPTTVVVSSDIFTTVNGVSASLVLPCNAAGLPPPFLRWFREDTPIEARFVTRYGTLVMNVSNTSYIEAPREGVRYHCTATNIIAIDPFIIATTRSSDYHVFYTYFDGFESLTTRTIELETIEGGAVAMRCDHKGGIPIPEITWYIKLGGAPGNKLERAHSVYLEHGRYLVIDGLTSEERRSRFYCMVTNAYLGTAPQRSFITYTLNRDIPANQLIMYKQNTQFIATVGSALNIAYPVAYREGPVREEIGFSCRTTDNFHFGSNSIIGAASGFTNAGVENIQCSLIFGTSRNVFVLISILVLQHATITSPTSAINRDAYFVEETSEITLVCEYQGLPVPSISWYYNGVHAAGRDGITVSDVELIILQPKITHSGVYQCFVSNTVEGLIVEDQRLWVLEIKNTMLPQIEQVWNSNNMIIEDSLIGLLLITDGFNSPAVIISVYSDPCPTVQWMFNGIPISTDSNYIVSNPCNNEHGLTTDFTLSIITRHTMSRSGRYTALFSHIGGSATSPSIYITVPVPVTLSSLSVEVESTGEQQPACLPEGSSVILTCGFIGFPRPTIRFRKDLEVLNTDFCGRFSIIGTGKLRISRVEMIDEGVYTCETETENGAVIQLTPTPSILTVCSFPEIRAFQLPEFPVSGRELALHCAVTGTPQVTVTWFKDSQPLISSNNLSILNDNGVSRVSIGVVSQEDGGEYVCTATNEAGSSSANWRIRLPTSATSTSSVTESDPTTSLIISGSTSRSVPESTWASSSTASVSTSFTTTLGTDPGMNQVSSLPTPNSGGHNVRAGSCLMVSMILSLSLSLYAP